MADDFAADDARKLRINKPDSNHRCRQRMGGTRAGAEPLNELPPNGLGAQMPIETMSALHFRHDKAVRRDERMRQGLVDFGFRRQERHTTRRGHFFASPMLHRCSCVRMKISPLEMAKEALVCSPSRLRLSCSKSGLAAKT